MDEDNLQASPQLFPSDPMSENMVDEKTAFDRFIEAITAPADAFIGLNRLPRKKSIIIWGMVIGIVVNTIALLLVSATPGFIDLAKEKQLKPLEKMYENGKIEKKDYDKAVERIESFDQNSFLLTQMLPYVLLMLPLWWIIVSAVLYGICRAIGPPQDESVTYTTAWSAYMIALMVSHIETLLTAVALYFTKNFEFSMSPSAFIHSENIFVAKALSLINPFTVWWLFVIGIGITVIAKAARGKAIGIWAAFWVILNLAIGAIGQLLAGMFGGR